ncbi:MAG: hypothetical protein K6T86_03360 [Pirellulales bacterium]|nr:hypothetical protein [Pirellulales bacterium]
MKPLRIAMWSGPRNISTALLRSWGSRPDTIVCDEPLYAHYLLRTGKPHPGAEEVIRCHETDWRRVVEWLLGALPEGKTIFYQKHMAHHLLPEIDRGWLAEVANCFLIRDPQEMLTSLVHNVPEPELADTGLPQQVEIFELVRRKTGRTPPVLDARDVLEQPEALLRRLCDALEVEFLPCMLRWEPGPRPTDGVWAKYWYAAVEQSTGFQPYRPKPERVPPALQPLEQQCRRLYEQLYAHRLTA